MLNLTAQEELTLLVGTWEEKLKLFQTSYCADKTLVYFKHFLQQPFSSAEALLAQGLGEKMIVGRETVLGYALTDIWLTSSLVKENTLTFSSLYQSLAEEIKSAQRALKAARHQKVQAYFTYYLTPLHQVQQTLIEHAQDAQEDVAGLTNDWHQALAVSYFYLLEKEQGKSRFMTSQVVYAFDNYRTFVKKQSLKVKKRFLQSYFPLLLRHAAASNYEIHIKALAYDLVVPLTRREKRVVKKVLLRLTKQARSRLDAKAYRAFYESLTEAAEFTSLMSVLYQEVLTETIKPNLT